MSKPYFSVKHVESIDNLPEKLTPGRIYFVDDEQVIVIDHGDGLPPIVYGGKPGPMGPSGEPQPHLQDQINTLAQAEVTMQNIIWQEGLSFRDSIKRVEEKFSETFSLLQDMSNTNAQTIMRLAASIKDSFDRYDSAIATLGKAVAALYPDQHPQYDDDDEQETEPVLAQRLNVGENVKHDGANLRVLASSLKADGSLSLTLQSLGAFSDKSDPLDNETVSTDTGTWTIQQSIMSDGSTVLDLTAQPHLLDTLKNGDTVQNGEEYYTVSELSKSDDGTISITLS